MIGVLDESFDVILRFSRGLQFIFKELSYGINSIRYINYSIELEKCYFLDLFLCNFFVKVSLKIEIERFDMFLF